MKEQLRSIGRNWLLALMIVVNLVLIAVLYTYFQQQVQENKLQFSQPIEVIIVPQEE